MGFLTSSPVLFVALWLGVILVLRTLFVLFQRQREHERYAASGQGSRAVQIGATDVRAALLVAAVATVVLAVGLTWRLLAAGPDQQEVESAVSEAASTFSSESVDEPPELTTGDVLDRVEDAGLGRDDVRVHEVAPGWEPDDFAGTRGIRFQVTTVDGDNAQCVEVTWREADGGYSVTGTTPAELC